MAGSQATGRQTRLRPNLPGGWMKEGARLDVQHIIDEQAFGPQHLRVLLLCALSVFMDGFDAQAMGFVAPTLSKEWHIARGALGPILTAGLVGMLVGALVF